MLYLHISPRSADTNMKDSIFHLYKSSAQFHSWGSQAGGIDAAPWPTYQGPRQFWSKGLALRGRASEEGEMAGQREPKTLAMVYNLRQADSCVVAVANFFMWTSVSVIHDLLVNHQLKGGQNTCSKWRISTWSNDFSKCVDREYVTPIDGSYK